MLETMSLRQVALDMVSRDPLAQNHAPTAAENANATFGLWRIDGITRYVENLEEKEAGLSIGI